jgi:hypothetical protein
MEKLRGWHLRVKSTFWCTHYDLSVLIVEASRALSSSHHIDLPAGDVIVELRLIQTVTAGEVSRQLASELTAGK